MNKKWQDRIAMRAEYEVCQRRGHEADSYITIGMQATRGICKWCGTQFWEETIYHEANVPTPPPTSEDEG